MLMPTVFGENLFDDFFKAPVMPRFSRNDSQLLKTNVKESEEGFELDFALPGIKKEDIKAELKDGYLTISCSYDNKEEGSEEKKYIRKEHSFGSASRSFYVGDNLTIQDIKAKYEDGILKVSVPKKEALPAEEETKYIAIE
ncbi:MAG: Hsp20/alpha crystallin family protein [Firmicutes bacterium]|nr:Hsp20/alpha crystallin family protein [Bacillota bacterium]